MEKSKGEQYIMVDVEGDRLTSMRSLKEICERNEIMIICDSSIGSGDIFFNPVQRGAIVGDYVKEKSFDIFKNMLPFHQIRGHGPD